MSEEIKPCPFCGFEEPTRQYGYILCRNSGCYLSISDPPFEKEWQNAYCWKEIDKKEIEIGRLVGQLAHMTRKFEVAKEMLVEIGMCSLPNTPYEKRADLSRKGIDAEIERRMKDDKTK